MARLPVSLSLLLVAALLSPSVMAYSSSKHVHHKGTTSRVMQEDFNKPPSQTKAGTITQALLKDDATAAAQRIAEASAAGDVNAVASSLAWALANGKSQVAAHALTQAMAQGGNTSVLGQAAAQAIPDQAPRQDVVNAVEKNDPNVVADKLNQGYQSSVRSVATSSSGTLTQAKNATASAVAAAISQACQGDVQAASQALARAVATASATAWAKSQATVTVEGTGSGCVEASASATAVAEAIATATVEAFAAATSNCNEAVAAAKAADTKTAITKAIAESSASACSTGGTASASSEVVSTAIATATASAYVEALAAVSGPCAACGHPVQAPKQSDDAPAPSPSPSPKPAARDTAPKAPQDAQPEPKSISDQSEPDTSVDEPVTRSTTNKPQHDAKGRSKDASKAQHRQQQPTQAYPTCFSWLKDDCCTGYKGRTLCHCFGFGLRSIGDICQYKLVSGAADDNSDAPLVWQDRWSNKLCQCSS